MAARTYEDAFIDSMLGVLRAKRGKRRYRASDWTAAGLRKQAEKIRAAWKPVKEALRDVRMR